MAIEQPTSEQPAGKKPRGDKGTPNKEPKDEDKKKELSKAASSLSRAVQQYHVAISLANALQQDIAGKSEWAWA
eukprot:14395416-Alexandrium_andersonii.AAC.1